MVVDIRIEIGRGDDANGRVGGEEIDLAQMTGRVEIMDEYVDCEESGTWTMDPADSESTASMTWQLEKTSCPGREGGKEIRVKITIERDGSYEILMH